MKRTILLLYTALLAGASTYAQDVFSYLADFKEVAFYGFADSAGNTKTPGKYNLIMRPSEGLCRVWAGQKSSSDYASIRYGFCLPNGTEIIAPQFNKAEDFSEGLAQVASGDVYKGYSYGYVNTKGVMQIAMQYKDAKKFSEGLAPVSIGEKKWQYIDKTGTVKIAGPFLDADVFSEGLAGVSVPYDLGSGVMSFHKGYVDATGKMVIQPEYNYVMPFKNGLAVVSFSGSTPSGYKSYQLLIDKTGKKLTTQEFVSIYHIPFEGLYAVKISGSSGLNSENDVWGVIDTKGVLQPARFKNQPYFNEGLAVFSENGLAGFKDKNDKVIIKPAFKSVTVFSDGLAGAQFENGLWGYINKKGETVIKPAYISVGKFSDGVAVVSIGKSAFDKDKQTGVIDKTGKLVIPMQKRAIGDFKNGKAIAEENYISFYVYKNGTTSLACDAATLANGRYAFQALARNDVQSALTMFKKESGKNCAMIDYWTGYILLQTPPPMRDTVLGVQLMEQSAKKGYPEAMYSAGFMYLNGLAVKKDEAIAKQWLVKAGKAGVPVAYTLLGTAEDKNNPAQAATYYQQAADLGEPVAMYYLALLYRDGRGVTKNDYQSNTWLQRSAQLNYQPAKQLLTQKSK
ncbi:MAG TPA: SEL1-like repeat protein [Chitinophagaceae bacterium]|nr:SEL1-like repeat protein [Chitinophagaceae bacterium]